MVYAPLNIAVGGSPKKKKTGYKTEAVPSTLKKKASLKW